MKEAYLAREEAREPQTAAEMAGDTDAGQDLAGALWTAAAAVAEAETALHAAAAGEHRAALKVEATRREVRPALGYFTPSQREAVCAALARVGRELVTEHWPGVRFFIAPTAQGRHLLESAERDHLAAQTARSEAEETLRRAQRRAVDALREGGGLSADGLRTIAGALAERRGRGPTDPGVAAVVVAPPVCTTETRGLMAAVPLPSLAA